MVNSKRVVIATLFGVVAGILCYLGALSLNFEIDALRLVFILVNRTLIGFVIGISALRMNWILHGFVLGEIVGLPFFIYDLILEIELPILLAVLILSGVFGIMIEFFATLVFKSPVE